MKNILVIGLLACAMLGLTACKDPDNQFIVPKKYQGEWCASMKGESVCEVFPDKIIFYRFPMRFSSPSDEEHFVNKYFELSSLNSSSFYSSLGIMFDTDISTFANNAMDVIAVQLLENNVLDIALYAWRTIEGKEILSLVDFFHLFKGEQSISPVLITETPEEFRGTWISWDKLLVRSRDYFNLGILRPIPSVYHPHDDPYGQIIAWAPICTITKNQLIFHWLLASQWGVFYSPIDESWFSDSEPFELIPAESFDSDEDNVVMKISFAVPNSSDTIDVSRMVSYISATEITYFTHFKLFSDSSRCNLLLKN